MIAVWISIFGGLGAATRFVSDGLLRALIGKRFPAATLVINIVGSFILGLVTGLVAHKVLGSGMKAVIGTGFCGGFTTFSTASFEAVRLIEERRFKAAAVHVGGGFVACLVAAAVGLWLG